MSQSSDAHLLHAEAQAWLAAIVESSDDAIVSKTLEGVIVSWNKAAEHIFGYTADEAIGRSILMLIPPGRENEEPQILARLRAGERVDHFETVRVRKDGQLIEISVTISPVRDSTGQVIGASKVARDISSQKLIQRDLQAAKEAADKASRAKDHFLNVLSHELRTPLTPVLAAISHVENNPHLPAEVLSEQISMIRRNIEIEARLVDDLLDLTRVMRDEVQLHFETVDAHAALRAAVTMLQSDADAKSVAIKVAFSAQSFQIWADPGRLQQIFLNLLSNAIKFTPANGSITIRSNNRNGDTQNAWCVEFSDTGIGIDAEVLPHIFGAFEQGRQAITSQFGGLGVGLAIVKSMVAMHGGTVTANSEGQGKGATFGIEFKTIPAAPRAITPDSAANAFDNVGAGRPLLLVEDHADTRMVLRHLLAGLGFAVFAAGSVREALDLAAREKIELLVSDIGLPDGSGVDLMRELKQRQPIRGIALSGYGQDEDLRRSTEAGFLKHLIKPVNFQTLRDEIVKLAS